MASPPRNKKGQAFQPMAAEALGLSIHPTSNEVQSSPPLAAVPNSMLATAAAASTSQPSSKRGSQIRQSSGGSGPLGPSALSQEVAPSSPEFHPPSPSHTASPPQASSNFSPQFQPQLQQSPSQMPTTGGTYGWTQNRIPAPTLNSNAATGPRLTSDSWVQPDSDVLIPPLQPKKQQIQSPPGPAVEEREEVLQHTPPRSNGDWTARGGGGTLADAMAQRTSPTAQLLQGNQNGVRAGGVNANRPRARGPTQSSSPVMMQAVRQAALQNSPPQQPAQAAQVRGTPPSLQGLIAPNVNPPPPILPRANTENPAASAVAAGVRPLGGTPPNVNSYQRNNAASPPGTRNPSTTMSSTSSPPYHTPMESLQGGTSYLSESSSYSALPFEYDQDEDDVRHRSPQQYYTNQPQPDPRNRTNIDSYRRDQDSPPPIHIRTVPNQASSSMPPPQPQVQPPQPQVQTQAVPRLGLYPSQPASAVSGTGSHIRAQPARSFPVVDEEVDDDVVAVPQQQPAARPHPTHSSSQPPPATRWVSQSRERERERSPEQVRAPSPPPAPPVQHPPIPLYSPQSVQAGQPAVLRDNSPRRDSSTPSPPVPLRINPDAGNRRPSEEDMEAAEPSSDSFTPKSPNVALPADHTYPYANNNLGRMGSHNRMPQPAPYSPVDPYGSYGGSLHHALFAMQMGGMPAPRGPLANYNNYGARDGFTSLSGAAAALTGKPESPYPAPPSNNNANGTANKHGPGGFAGGSADSGGSYNYDSSQSSQPWEGPEHLSYADFVEWQRKMYSNRPDAPIPPTPQSYASPQQAINQQGFGGDQRNGMNANRENDGKGTQASNGHGYNVPAYGNGYGPGAMLDPSMIPDRYIPSALSSYLSSPMMHNPFLPRFPAPQSLVSSPSHIPLDLGPAPIGGRRLHKKKSKRQLRGAGSGTSKGGASSSVPKTSSKLKESIGKPPTPPPAEEFPRVESTVPRDTSSEESDTDDTKKGGSTRKPAASSGPVVSETEEEEEDDDDVWLDESSEDELDVEYHSRYIQNPSKRKRKWEQKWDTMVRLFQEIDRTTDSPMVLLASPSTAPSPKTHVLVSRAMLRNPGKYMPHAQNARQSFVEIAKMRRKEKADAAAAERARRAAGFEQQLAQIPFLGPRWDAGSADSGGRGSSSPGSAGFGPQLGGLEKLQDLPTLAAGGEDGLKQALSVALDSLKQMHIIYEQREERRREELERQRQEAAGLENLFRMMAIESAAGSSQGSGPAGAGSPASSSGVPTLSGKKSP